MKLGRLNHIGVATPSIADSVAYYREVMGATKILMSRSTCPSRG